MQNQASKQEMNLGPRTGYQPLLSAGSYRETLGNRHDQLPFLNYTTVRPFREELLYRSRPYEYNLGIPLLSHSGRLSERHSNLELRKDIGIGEFAGINTQTKRDIPSYFQKNIPSEKEKGPNSIENSEPRSQGQEVKKDENTKRESSLKRDSCRSDSQGVTTRVINGRISETIIEHPPIIRGVYERQGAVYSNYLTPKPPSCIVMQGQHVPGEVNSYTTVTERLIEHNKEGGSEQQSGQFSSDLKALARLKEENEELNSKVVRSELYTRDEIHRLKETIENLQNKLADADNKYRKTMRDFEDLTLKMETKTEAHQALKEKYDEIETESRQMKARYQKLEVEKATANSERLELEAQVRRLTSELSSKSFANEMQMSELLNKLKTSEDKNHHLERMALAAEEEIARLTRELREKIVLNHADQERISSERIGVSTSKFVHIREGEDSEGLVSLYETKLRAKSSEISEWMKKYEDAEARLRMMEQKLREEKERAERERKSFKEDMEKLEGEKRNMSLKYEDARGKHDESQRLLREANDNIENLQRKYELLKDKIKRLEQDLLKKEAECQSHIQEKKRIEGLLEDLQIENQKLKKQMEARNNEVISLTSDLNDKSSKIEAANRRIKEADNQMDDLRYQIKGLEKAVAIHENSKASNNRSQIDEKGYQEEIDRLQELLKELSEQALSKEDELVARIEELESIIKELEETNEKLQEQVGEYEAKIEELESEMEQLADLSEKLACDNTTLQRKVEILTAQVDALLQQQDDGEKSCDMSEKLAYQLRRLIDFVRYCYQNYEKDREIEQLSKQLEETVQIANDRLVTIEKVQVDNGRLLNQVAEAYQELEKIGIKIQNPTQ